ncbi:DnaJ-like protein [Zancudomyces culisetae]|uniref:DnaJ-like protein n=1 Tax=Zancudomyces culisetae TaxID=1213189 RepID=A0A1R1PPH0_ZANCU|nr:DnaJ-like protein [Zancudomyces culisetae]|eukprot:OMH82875.1 DnaJ-like protein [Zancudomyces culisetae]
MSVVSAAFTTLSDPDKRAHYDRFGSADGNAGASRATNMNFRRGPEGAQFFEGEVTPEELFNMFFGGGMHSGNPFHTTSTHTFRMPRRRQGQGYYTRNGADAGEDKQTILLSNVIGTFLSADSGAKYYPDFSFTPSKKLNTKRTTNRNNIKYYVNFNQFAKNKRSNLSKFDLKSFEKHVEGNYINILNTECQNQRIRKNGMINDAYGFLGLFVDEDKLKMAKEMSLPACDELSRLYY